MLTQYLQRTLEGHTFLRFVSLLESFLNIWWLEDTMVENDLT